MLRSVTILLVFQLFGEVAVRTLALPIPGPVIGMLLLFALLVARGAAPAGLAETAHGLLQQLSLLYVPAGVGVMVHVALIRQQWLPIVLTLLISTVLTLLVTALVMRWLVRLAARGAVR